MEELFAINMGIIGDLWEVVEGKERRKNSAGRKKRENNAGCGAMPVH